MRHNEINNGNAKSVWDQQLRSMTEISGASMYSLKEPLALLGLTYICQRDGIALSNRIVAEQANIISLAEAVEKHNGLEGQPFRGYLLSGLKYVEPAVISSWLEVGAGAWSLAGFCEWYTAKLDELGFADRHDTPSSVSRLIASLFADRVFGSVLDPACGTGGLLAAAAEHAAPGADLFGHEMSGEAWAWANMRLLVCGLKDITLTTGNALIDQTFARRASDRGFDIIMTNPPFGMHLDPRAVSLLSRQAGKLIGSPARLSSEATYIQEVFGSLSCSGMAAVIVPNGFLVRGGVDRRLREALVHRDAVQAVIGLPARLFAPGTMIETAILVLNRGKVDNERERILFLDARGLGSRRGGRAVLDDEAVWRIKTACSEWKAEEGFSEIVPLKKLDLEGLSFSPAHYVKPVHSPATTNFIDRRSRIIELDERYATLLQEYETLRSQLARLD